MRQNLRLAPIGVSVLLFLAFADASDARADGTRVGLRLGGGTLDLTADGATPLLGGYFDDAARTYDVAATAYNRYHGYRDGTEAAAPTMSYDDMSMRASLMVLTPSFAVGGTGYFFRLDTPIGFGDGVRTYGLGIYPVNVATALSHRHGVEGYASAGVIMSYLTQSDAASRGALLEGRLAAGVRWQLSREYATVVELGYGVYGLGAVVDTALLGTLDEYDPRSVQPPPRPGDVVRGGGQQGRVDLAFGVELP